MKKIAFALLSGLFFWSSCDKEVEPVPLNLPLKTQEIIASDNTFGLNLFRDVLENAEQSENVMISPLSVSLALTMTYNGAEGDTRIAMEQAMEMTGLNRDEINQLNQQLVEALLAHDPSVTLEIANSIWYRDDFTVKPSFVEVNQTYYDAVVNAMDFSDPGTIEVINQWVADQTHERIEKIVDQINGNSFMFLINAIYFKGNWRYEFDKKETRDGEFYVSADEQVLVPMMHQELDLNMCRQDLFTAVELPYGKGNWSMFVFVPEGDHHLDDLVSELNSDNWNQWMDQFYPTTEVNLTLPKFTFEYETSLADALKAMGMDVAFSSQADFSGMLDGGGLLISDVKHKTFVEVNEEGTEAAAVTSVEIELTSIGNYFSVNRPFLFVIAEKSSNAILFAGRVVKP